MSRFVALAAAATLLGGSPVAPAPAAPAAPVPVASAVTVAPARLATAISAVASAATKRNVSPLRGEGLIAMTRRICGSSSTWRQQAALNGLRPPYWLYLGRTYSIDCTASKSTASKSTASKPATSKPATSTGSSSGWVKPLASYRVTSCYGPRWGAMHYGIDMAAASGTPIRSIHAGTVHLRRYQAGGAGYYVVISHGDGVYSVYMHMRAHSPLAVNAKVKAGQTIGYVGSTGDSTGPHLHLEIHQGLWSNRVNPAGFMRARGVNLGC